MALSIPSALADDEVSGAGMLQEGSGGILAEAGIGYAPQADSVPSAGGFRERTPICVTARTGDGGVPFDVGFASTAFGDCVTFVIFRRAALAELAPDEIQPIDLLPSAWDRVRSLAESPQLTISPAALGLTGLPSYFWLAETPPTVSATAEIPGLSVTAEASPVGYVWRFEDDSASTTTHAGRKHGRTQRGNVSHTYETKGTYTVGVEVVYEARWRIGTGPWQPLGYFSNTDSADYQVQELIAVLRRSRR